MKKILTLFVMFLCGWSIVSAQTPAFGYQAVVRNADNELVANTDVNVTITVMSGTSVRYIETQTGKTDNLGMLNLLVGTGTPTPANTTDFVAIDWSTADTIVTTIVAGENTYELKTALRAVPYAYQAGNSPLTTQQIVDYLSNPSTNIYDYRDVMAALVGNVPTEGELWDMIKARVVQYLINRKAKAVDVFVDYIKTKADSDDVVALYNKVSDEAKTKAMSLAKQYALENKEYAMELVKAYLPLVDENDAGEAMQAAIISFNSMKQELTHEDSVNLINHAVSFVNNHLDLAVRTAKYFIKYFPADKLPDFLSTVFENSQMKQAFVNNLFYNYLDYTLLPLIMDKLNNNQELNKMLPKKCGTEEIDYCGMQNVLED